MKRLVALMVAAVAAEVMATPTPTIVSSQIRANDPTILDVVYKVTSDKPTVNVRALAFEDGERRFWKVVRPETFVKDTDGNETTQNIGDGIAANVEHKLAWKVSADWKTDLAKVKFEVLTTEMAQLPLKTVTIPAVAGKSPEIKVYGTSQTAANCFNALLWHYADSASDLQIEDLLAFSSLPTYRDYPPSVSDFDYKVSSVSRHYVAGNSTPIESESPATEAIRAELGKVKFFWNDVAVKQGGGGPRSCFRLRTRSTTMWRARRRL